MCPGCPGAGGCPRQRVPELRDCPRPVRPSVLLPSPCRVPGDVRMLGKEEAEEEGKAARLPPPPLGAGPLAGAQGRGGGARDESAERHRSPFRPQPALLPAAPCGIVLPAGPGGQHGPRGGGGTGAGGPPPVPAGGRLAPSPPRLR